MRLKHSVVLWEVLRADDVLRPLATVGAGNRRARLFERAALDLVEAGLAEGVATAQHTRDLVDFIVLEKAD